MKTSQIISTVSTLIDANVSSFLWGTSSIGKASIIEQVAANKQLEFFKIDSSSLNPKEIWTASSLLPKEGKGILFFNDLDSASSDIQSFAYELIAYKKAGNYTLLEGWNIIACGNTDKIPSSLANHFVHLEIQVEVHDWKNWAYNSGIDERIIAYISYKNEALFSLNVENTSFASPASWEHVSKILRSGLDESLLLEVISGTIGKDTASSFLTFCEAVYQLPDIEAILQEGEAEFPEEKDVLYTLSCVLVSFLLQHQNEDNLKNVLKYISNLDSEFSDMIVRDLEGSGVMLKGI